MNNWDNKAGFIIVLILVVVGYMIYNNKQNIPISNQLSIVTASPIESSKLQEEIVEDLSDNGIAVKNISVEELSDTHFTTHVECVNKKKLFIPDLLLKNGVFKEVTMSTCLSN